MAALTQNGVCSKSTKPILAIGTGMIVTGQTLNVTNVENSGQLTQKRMTTTIDFLGQKWTSFQNWTR